MTIPYGFILIRGRLKRLTPKQMIKRRIRQHNRQLQQQARRRSRRPTEEGA